MTQRPAEPKRFGGEMGGDPDHGGDPAKGSRPGTAIGEGILVGLAEGAVVGPLGKYSAGILDILPPAPVAGDLQDAAVESHRGAEGTGFRIHKVTKAQGAAL